MYEALEISLRVITYLKVTIFLGVTNSSNVTSLPGVIVSLAKVAYSIESTSIKGIGTEDANIEGASIKNTCIKRVYIRKVYIEVVILMMFVLEVFLSKMLVLHIPVSVVIVLSSI